MSRFDHSASGNGLPPAKEGQMIQNVDDQWIVIQRNTFTNWVREQLSGLELSVDDIQTDLADGTRLCALMEVLQHRRIPHVIKKPMNQHQCLDNVNIALRAMVDDGIKLVNIGAEDIISGNLKLILGLIWRLILRYQIGRGKTPPKKLMLCWINAVVPDMAINNFSFDWNDGLALHGLIEYCRPGTCPNWRRLNRSDRLLNCERGMEMAKQLFSIPLVLTPGNLSSPDLDELSGMTYLSYFMKVDSPGYRATMKWVREQIPQNSVKNFQRDWNDGKVLTALVESVGGKIAANNDHGSHVDKLQRAMYAAKALGVEPIITAREMSDSDVDHLGVMAVAARLERCAPRKQTTEQATATRSQVKRTPPLSPALPSADPDFKVPLSTKKKKVPTATLR